MTKHIKKLTSAAHSKAVEINLMTKIVKKVTSVDTEPRMSVADWWHQIDAAGGLPAPQDLDRMIRCAPAARNRRVAAKITEIEALWLWMRRHYGSDFAQIADRMGSSLVLFQNKNRESSSRRGART